MKMKPSKVGFDNLCTITFNFPLYFASLNESFLAFNYSTIKLNVFDVKHNVELPLDWTPLEVTKYTVTLKVDITPEHSAELQELEI